MIIRNSFLAFLSSQPNHGYGLKSSFEASTGGAWRLNAGQVYTTLSRLERDGLIEADDGDAPERRAWQLTHQGQRALADWYDTPVDNRSTRDELVIKVLVAIAAGEPDIQRVLQTQRSATMRRLQELTRNKIATPTNSELPDLLLLDAMILRAESEIRWLDQCEQRLQASWQGASA